MVKQGLSYFTDNRVIGVALENGSVLAEVEDENDEQYWLELSAECDGGLAVVCDCHLGPDVCVHAIAALYAYADQYAPIDATSLDSAVDEAIQERVKKGCNEVRVKLLSGNLGFGTWPGDVLGFGDALAAFVSSANPLAGPTRQLLYLPGPAIGWAPVSTSRRFYIMPKSSRNTRSGRIKVRRYLSFFWPGNRPPVR